MIRTRTAPHLFFVLCAFALSLFPFLTSAATLSLLPVDGTYAVNGTITVEVHLSSSGEQVLNAVSGNVQYPSAMLNPVSISREGSIIDLWLTEPSLQNTQGTIAFEGLVLNPGFSGEGTLFTIDFTVIAEGVGTVEFIDGLALANDGFGTNVLNEFVSADLVLRGEGDLVPRAQSEIIVPSLTYTMFDTGDEMLSPPIITTYTHNPNNIGDFSVEGVTYPSSEIVVLIQHGDVLYEDRVASDHQGNFRYKSTQDICQGIVPKIASPNRLCGEGLYTFQLAVARGNSVSGATETLHFFVPKSPFTGIIVGIALLIIIALVLFLLRTGLLPRAMRRTFMWTRSRHHKKRVR